MATVGRPRKNPLPPLPGSIALISPQQYLKLSGLGPPTLIPRILKFLSGEKKGKPPLDRKTMQKTWMGNVTRLPMLRFISAIREKAGENSPGWVAEGERTLATKESWEDLNQPRTGLAAVEVVLEAGDWQLFLDYWLPKPDPADGRNADFFASHLLPMQSASFEATRLATQGSYAEALQTLERSPIGPYVDWQPVRDALPTIRDAGDFANRIANARLLSVLFVLVVLEHHFPIWDAANGSFLADLMPFQRDGGQFDLPFARLVSVSQSLVGGAGADKLLALENPESMRRRKNRWQKMSMDWSMPSHHTLVQLWREVAEIRSVERPADLHAASERLYRDLHLLTELGRIVSSWPHSLHPDGFNGFFGLYRTIYDDMAAAPRTKAPPSAG